MLNEDDLKLLTNRDEFAESNGKLFIRAQFIPQVFANNKLYDIDIDRPMYLDYTDVLLSMDAKTISAIVTGRAGERLPSYETDKNVACLKSDGWIAFEKELCDTLKQKNPAVYKHSAINNMPFAIGTHHGHIFDFFAYNGFDDIYNLTEEDMTSLRGKYGLSEKVTLPNGSKVCLDSDGFVSGIVTVNLNDILDGDLECFLDLISEKLAGSLNLGEINYETIGFSDDNEVALFVEGEVSMILDEIYDDDHLHDNNIVPFSG